MASDRVESLKAEFRHLQNRHLQENETFNQKVASIIDDELGADADIDAKAALEMYIYEAS